jgi:hypothetical protein
MYSGKRKRSSYHGSQGRFKRGRTSLYSGPKSPRRRGQSSSAVHYRRTASQAVIRQPSGVPDRLYVKLRYREQLIFTQASGNLSENIYRGNSVFDPDLTGTGGQPLGFDQWTAFYGSYTVLGSSIEVESMCNGTTVTNCRVGVFPSLFSTSLGTTDQEKAEEQPYCQSRSLQMGNVGIGQGRLKAYMSTNKIWGVVRPAVQIEDGYSALVSANPSDSWFWHVFNYVPGATTQSLMQNVILTYFVVFESRTMLAVS